MDRLEPSDGIPPSPMQVYMLSTSDNNKSSNYTNNKLSDGATRHPTTQHRNEQFNFDNMSPPSPTICPNCQNCKRQQIDDSRDDVHTQCHHRHIPSHHPAHNTNTNSYHHPHRIDIEGDDHRYSGERAYHHSSESNRQYYPQQQQHSYNHHPRRTQSDPPPPPPTPTHPPTHVSDPHCRLVSSDSETIFHRNGHNHSSGCRNTSSCVGRLCGGRVKVDEDYHVHREDHGYHPDHHSRQITSPNYKCTDNRYHHHHHHPQEDYREYDPSMDRRHYDRADNYGRHELRDAPPPPPLSRLTIPTVVNCPAAVADNNRRYHGCPQTSTEATICSDGGGYDDYNDRLDRRGYHSHPQDCCHHHDHRTDGYNHKQHPYNYDHTRNASTRDVYSSTTEYTPSPRHHRHPPPPPPPPPPPYASSHHVDYPPNQQPHSYPYETGNKSRLRIEIPNSPPPMLNQHTSSTIQSSSRRPPIHNNLNGNVSRSRAQSNPHRQYHSTTTAPSSSTFAEYEKSQSEARQHLLREISAATTMRNSALDEDDRKFWERQIDTLNQSFRKL